ncbi:hypothetical protein [Vibrio parahaemolyticus]|uniref:hypothetical protein n=1 Tax=Vibrio parahaemolyticus TaxID=670 RepID=UPI0007A0B864|nr:hypothetical protein [Vibrio parahaemolyticus]EIZ0688939.1 hypothetical protein [Vibrio parahaemolyticus]EJS4061622.1 hypothetical protein [Vibrio parahaemolyticus]KYY40198.1 hypothetical protein AWQ17_02605 [Vibrio parahaemolyticus]KYY40204.1 hypothetical protein AWQ17_02640 [Vibrio parahaemolyticus]HCE4641413.1 hypothetical protein [Vibrio parahaemolyticus]
MLKFNGKKVPNGKLADVVMNNAYQKIDLQLNDKLKGLVCAEHAETPVASFDPTNSQVNISGCCETVILEAKARLEEEELNG